MLKRAQAMELVLSPIVWWILLMVIAAFVVSEIKVIFSEESHDLLFSSKRNGLTFHALSGIDGFASVVYSANPDWVYDFRKDKIQILIGGDPKATFDIFPHLGYAYFPRTIKGDKIVLTKDDRSLVVGKTSLSAPILCNADANVRSILQGEELRIHSEIEGFDNFFPAFIAKDISVVVSDKGDIRIAKDEGNAQRISVVYGNLVYESEACALTQALAHKMQADQINHRFEKSDVALTILLGSVYADDAKQVAPLVQEAIDEFISK